MVKHAWVGLQQTDSPMLVDYVLIPQPSVRW